MFCNSTEYIIGILMGGRYYDGWCVIIKSLYVEEVVKNNRAVLVFMA